MIQSRKYSSALFKIYNSIRCSAAQKSQQALALALAKHTVRGYIPPDHAVSAKSASLEPQSRLLSRFPHCRNRLYNLPIARYKLL
jgi:hypothetical protein